MGSDTRQLVQAAQIVRRWWWLLVVAALVAAGAGYVATKRVSPTYESTTTIFINTAPVQGSLGSDSTSVYSTMLAKAFATMIDSYRVANAVISRTHVALSPRDLVGEIHAASLPDVPILTIAVRDHSKTRAAFLADAVATTFIDLNRADQNQRYSLAERTISSEITALNQRIDALNKRIRDLSTSSTASVDVLNSLNGQLSNLQNSVPSLNAQLNNLLLSQTQSLTMLTITEHAQTPVQPISPNVRFNLLLSLLAGLLVAISAIVLMEYLDDSLKSPALVEEKLKVPVLAAIAPITGAGDALLVANKPYDPAAEAFKLLRTNIGFRYRDGSPRSLLIASPLHQEGKSTIAANYAVAVAEAGQQVMLIDTDLRAPRLQRLFDLPDHPGLSDVLRDPNLGLSIVQHSGIDNLTIVTSGPIPPNPAELLSTRFMAEFLELAKSHADVVVLDSPALLQASDALALANRVDGVVLLLDAKKTPMAAAYEAVQSLQMVGGHVLGVVLNRFSGQHRSYPNLYHTAPATSRPVESSLQ